jgi:hypothetical protein
MKIKTPMTRSTAHASIIGIVIAALAFAMLGLWLFKRDKPKLNIERGLQEQRSILEGKIVEADRRIETIAPQIPQEEQKIPQVEKIIRQLEELQGTWNLLVSNRAQQRANAERLEAMRTLHADTVARVADLQQQLARAKWERESYEIERTRISSQLRVLESRKASVLYQLARIWTVARSWICFGAAMYLLGPVLLPIVSTRWRQRKQGVVVGGRAP